MILAVHTDYFFVQHSASGVFSARYELQCYERVRAKLKPQLTLTKFKTYSRNGKSGGKKKAIPYFKRRKSPEFSLSFYGQRIDCVEYFNCLGVTSDRRLYMTRASGTYVRFAESLFLSGKLTAKSKLP